MGKTRFSGTGIRIPFGTVPVPLIYAQEKVGTTNSVRDRYETGTVLIPIQFHKHQNFMKF